MRIKELPDRYKGSSSTNGFEYELIYRSEKVNTYKKTHIDTGMQSFEIYIRKFSKPFRGNEDYDIVECKPSDAVFGYSAFETREECDVRKYIDELEGR